MIDNSHSFSLDSLAIRLAADRGQAWHDLCVFPGYGRNIWRDAARQFVLREMPDAKVEVLPCPWEGDEVEYIVRAPAAEL